MDTATAGSIELPRLYTKELPQTPVLLGTEISEAAVTVGSWSDKLATEDGASPTSRSIVAEISAVGVSPAWGKRNAVYLSLDVNSSTTITY